MSQHPEVDIKIDVSNKQKVIEGLNSNESDFSLVSVLPKNVEVKTLELLENELVLVGQSEFKDLVVNKENSSRSSRSSFEKKAQRQEQRWRAF